MKSRDDKDERLRAVLAAIDETWEQLNSAIEYGDSTTALRLKNRIEQLAEECDRLTEDDAAKGQFD